MAKPHHRGGPRGGQQRQPDDEDRRQEIRKVFGDDYVDRILNPTRSDANDYIDRVKKFVERRRGITPSQLRNIFSQIKAKRDPGELYVLRPRLAYAAGRSDKEEMRELVVLLDDLIKRVDDKEKLRHLQSFFEAVIAYHKYFNPKAN